MTDDAVVGWSENETFFCCRHWILNLTI